MISKNCKELIEKAHIYLPYYGNGLSNHVPMSLCALSEMGASFRELKYYFETSTSQLILRNLESPNSDDGYLSMVLGNKESFETYYNYFYTSISKKGYEKVLKNELPILMKGVAGAAFHPLIRLKYALHSNSKKEIAISLAYWASHYLELNLNFEETDEQLSEIRKRIDNYTFNDINSKTITEDINRVCELLKGKSIKIQPKDISLSTISEFCLNEFSKNNNFTLLHTVTACHSLRYLLKYLSNKNEALRLFWEAILVANLSTGIKYNTIDIVNNVNIDWSLLKSKAIQSTNDHVIKLVYTCYDENSAKANPLYSFIAERAIRNRS